MGFRRPLRSEQQYPRRYACHRHVQKTRIFVESIGCSESKITCASPRGTYFETTVVQVHVVLGPFDRTHRLFDRASVVKKSVQIVWRFRQTNVCDEQMEKRQQAARGDHQVERHEQAQGVRDYDAEQNEHLVSHLDLTCFETVLYDKDVNNFLYPDKDKVGLKCI